jgi:hypothetical protein
MSKVKYVLYNLVVIVLLNEQHEINEENPNWVVYSIKKNIDLRLSSIIHNVLYLAWGKVDVFSGSESLIPSNILPDIEMSFPESVDIALYTIYLPVWSKNLDKTLIKDRTDIGFWSYAATLPCVSVDQLLLEHFLCHWTKTQKFLIKLI